MFPDFYRGNRTPSDRLWQAEDRLKDAKRELEAAERQHKEALEELAAFTKHSAAGLRP